MEQPIRYTARDIIAVKAIMIISIILDSSYILLPWLRKYQVDIELQSSSLCFLFYMFQR